MAFETLPDNLPAELEAQRHMGATNEELLSTLNERFPSWGEQAATTETSTETTTEVVTDTQTTTETTAATETTETTIETKAETPSFDFSKYGLTSEEELAATIEKYRELASKEEQFKDFERVKGEIENPFADPTIAKINGVVKTLGIKDVGVASQIAAITPESLAANPIEALTYQTVVNNPAILSQMSLSEVRAAIAERYGLDVNDLPETLPSSLRLDAANAIQDVQKKVESVVDNSTKVFSTLQSQKEQAASQLQEAQRFWNGVAEKAVSGLKEYTTEIRGKKVTVAVSPDTLKSIQQEIPVNFLSFPQDAAKEISHYVSARIEAAHKEAIFEAYEKAIEGSIKERIIQESHNGGQVVRVDKPNPEGAKKSEAVIAAEEYLGLK